MPRRKITPYFTPEPDAPSPLAAVAPRRVRFRETDPLGIVWHGCYPDYLEDGREAFGARYGLAYLDMHRQSFIAPIVQMHLDYHAPLRYPDSFSVTARLHWCRAARLNFDYSIVAADGALIATGYTVQLLMDLERHILLVRPPMLEDLWRRWQEGRIRDSG